MRCHRRRVCRLYGREDVSHLGRPYDRGQHRRRAPGGRHAPAHQRHQDADDELVGAAGGGPERQAYTFATFVAAANVSNVTIAGAGVIDGGGQWCWSWTKKPHGGPDFMRFV